MGRQLPLTGLEDTAMDSPAGPGTIEKVHLLQDATRWREERRNMLASPFSSGFPLELSLGQASLEVSRQGNRGNAFTVHRAVQEKYSR